jgi:PAS domain S-box-containing protein
MKQQSRMTGSDLTQALQSIETNPGASEELRHLAHELQRHQLELELQNRELQEAQQALEESRNRYMELYDFAPMACVSLDSRACIQDLNLTGASLLRQDRRYLQGLPFTPFVDPPDVSRFLLHVRQCIAGETLSTELKLRIEGRRFEVRLHSAPLDDGQFRGRMCRTAILDITELRQMQVRMSLVERLATVGTIAAGIAHEINNPLAFLMGNLSIATHALQAQPPALANPASASTNSHSSAEQALHALDEAQYGAERIREIVRDLSTFASPREPKNHRVNVQQVLELSVKLAMLEIRHRVQLVQDYAEVPEVIADQALLGQVFLNLLVNAAQAIPEGMALSNEIRLRIRASEQTVLVQIQDTGEGMHANVLEHVFEPFFTTKDVGKGMGLGLAISHSLVLQMGGSITAESSPGQGSTFTIRLPMATPLPQALPPSPQSPTVAGRRGRILIVDDEHRFGLTLQLLLGRAHDVTYTPSAREALTWIQAGRPYDVILCDLMMAEVTGRQFYEALSQHSMELARRVIFMTGGAYTPASLDFVAKMTNPLLTKPFKTEELEKLLATLLA